MASSQNGRCAICKAAPEENRWKTLYVDHCHATGAVRGLLCSKCKQGLGMFKDSPNLLEEAKTYLEKFTKG